MGDKSYKTKEFKTEFEKIKKRHVEEPHAVDTEILKFKFLDPHEVNEAELYRLQGCEVFFYSKSNLSRRKKMKEMFKTLCENAKKYDKGQIQTLEDPSAVEYPFTEGFEAKGTNIIHKQSGRSSKMIALLDLNQTLYFDNSLVWNPEGGKLKTGELQRPPMRIALSPDPEWHKCLQISRIPELYESERNRWIFEHLGWGMTPERVAELLKNHPGWEISKRQIHNLIDEKIEKLPNFKEPEPEGFISRDERVSEIVDYVEWELLKVGIETNVANTEFEKYVRRLLSQDTPPRQIPKKLMAKVVSHIKAKINLSK